jgi:hypothetical protein
VDTGVGMDEDALGGKALGAVTGDSVAVVEMTMLACVELDMAVIVEARAERRSCRVPLPVGVSHNLLIRVQPQLAVCASLSRVFSARAGAGGTDDFGTAG